MTRLLSSMQTCAKLPFYSLLGVFSPSGSLSFYWMKKDSFDGGREEGTLGTHG
jgi:hypothetical protein